MTERESLWEDVRSAAERLLERTAAYDEACSMGGLKRIRATRPGYEESQKDLRDALIALKQAEHDDFDLDRAEVRIGRDIDDPYGA